MARRSTPSLPFTTRRRSKRQPRDQRPPGVEEMTKTFTAIAAGLAILVGPGGALAQQGAPRMFVSPTKGQSQAQQDSDTAACQRWASEQAPPSQAPTG